MRDSGEDGPSPRVLCKVPELMGVTRRSAGALWKLAEPGRQLDANVVHLPPRHEVDVHTEPDLDVLVFVVAGAGELGSPEGTRQLAKGTLLWLPHGSTRSLSAGESGISYLTVHRRRPGMQIRMPD